jgi:hypothetical protein
MNIKQYSPEYNAQKALDARVRDAQRARVWTAVYAAVLPKFIDRTGTATAHADIAARHADEAVVQFDEAFP